MRAEIKPFFGQVPASADNLEIVGPFRRRFEEQSWATVWPGSGVIRWADGKIEIETIWVENNLKACGDFHSRWSWWPRRVRGRFFNLSLFWWPNYYHWNCDVLARLHGLLSRLDPDVQIILPPRLTTWQRRSLELIGLPLDRCVQFDGRRPWKVEYLVYVSPVAMTGDHEPTSLHWVRDTICNKLGCLPAQPGWRKLYLVRKNTRSRKVINEAELLPILQARGFEIVDCNTLNFAGQVRLFSEAACVVGPHGAAFTNILWSYPGTKVFEIFEPVSVRRCYWSMCRTLGHNHACGIGQTASQTKQEPDIHVPVQDFIEAIDEVIQTNP